MDGGIGQDSSSDWCTPIVLVTKASGLVEGAMSNACLALQLARPWQHGQIARDAWPIE